MNWRGYLVLRYMYILLYMTLNWCICFPEIYAQLEKGEVGSVCHGYMCILLFVKLIWSCCVAYFYGGLEGVPWT